jgi:glutamyl-tRNA reductase
MIGLIGLDHHSTGVELRGRVSFAEERLNAALAALGEDPAIAEAVILSTCNRTEVYVAGEHWPAAATAVRRFLAARFAQHANITAGGAASDAAPDASDGASVLPEALAQALYERAGLDVARHLFHVAAGLRSMVVGEPQILGQVKEALGAAEAMGTSGDELRALFTTAIKAGKRVRSETQITRADRSVAARAVRVAGEALGDLGGVSALLVGAGRTSQLCAHLLRAAGAGRILLANRTPATAATLAAEVGGEVISLGSVEAAIPEVRLVISATAAPRPVLRTADVARGVRGRHAPLVVFDLAVPPDVEEAVGLLPQVSLYTLDTLHRLDPAGSEAGLERTVELARAEEIVEEAVRELQRAQTLRLAVPGIAALRRHVDRSERIEVERALSQLEHLSGNDKAVVSRLGQRLVDKMFHHLVSRIRSLAEYDEIPPEVTMRVLTELFSDPDAPREPKIGE